MKVIHKTTLFLSVHPYPRAADHHRVEGTVYADVDPAREPVFRLHRVLARLPAQPAHRDCRTFLTVDLTPLYRETRAGEALAREVLRDFHPSEEEG